ncbi:hypothetical protein Tco_1509851, partial [Tanacetum coccineum]
TLNILKAKPLHVGTVHWNNWGTKTTSDPEAITKEKYPLRRQGPASQE